MKINNVGGEKMAMFRTIRQTASDGILTEHRLRKMQKDGKLPGIFVGNRFLIDQDALIEMLHEESAKSIVAN